MYSKKNNSSKWNINEIAYLYMRDNPKMPESEAYSKAQTIKAELNRLNVATHESNKLFFDKNVPFSEHYSHDGYTSYGDTENEF